MLEKLFGIFSKKQFSSIESSTLDLQKDLISYPALEIIRKTKGETKEKSAERANRQMTEVMRTRKEVGKKMKTHMKKSDT